VHSSVPPPLHVRLGGGFFRVYDTKALLWTSSETFRRWRAGCSRFEVETFEYFTTKTKVSSSAHPFEQMETFGDFTTKMKEPLIYGGKLVAAFNLSI
jgi:hypothetical protein